MEFFKLLSDNLWTTILLMLFIVAMVSIVLGIFLEVYKVSLRSSQKILELRNEELRLKLQLEQQKKQQAGSSADNLPLPKEPSWAEQSQPNYEMGYEQRW